MKVLYLDIETLPGDIDSSTDLEALKYLYERKLEKKSKKKDKSEGVIIEEETNKLSFDDYVRGTSFDGGFGRTLCIALAVNDDPVKCYCNDGNEKKTLEQFWEVASQVDCFVGHNVLDFDIRFLWQRSIVLGVKPTWQDTNPRGVRYMSFARYRSYPVFDIMHEWVKWGRDNIGLEHIALSLGLPTPKDGIDGSQVYDFYKKGEIDKICKYCKRDVDTTRAIYKRMVFSK